MNNMILKAIKKNEDLHLDFRLIKIYSVKTGLCEHDCAFCGQSILTKREFKVIKEFSSEDDFKMAIEEAINNKASEIMFSAGSIHERSELTGISSAIEMARSVGLDVCIDFGVIKSEYLKILFDAGANIYINSLQTAKSFFRNVCNTQKYDEKVKALETAKFIGFKTRSGGILGLGESEKQREEFARELQSISCDTVSICLFQPIKGSVMENHTALSSEKAMEALSIMRLIINKPIYLLGGREKILSKEDIKTAMNMLNGTTVGDYIFTQGESIEKLAGFINLKER